ncbi:MAG: type II secretion system F family protein [Lachnospiraceae bacterium]|nr:type II secretion system F family protein [Lachnospiraceae bacterium]
MPNYSYRAQAPGGKVVTGTMLASDETDLHERLKNQDMMLLSAKDVARSQTYKRLKNTMLAEYARQIGTLVRSGITLVRALEILSEDESLSPYERKIYNEVRHQVTQGIPLSDAMENMNGVFPPLIINMFRAAETSGGLDQTALRVANQYTKEAQLNAKVKSATTYPKILGFLIVGVVAIIFGFVMPQFESLFNSMESLPPATMAMMWISDFVKKNWLGIIIFCIFCYLLFYFLKKIPKVLFFVDMIQIKLPKFGHLFKVVYTARFCRTLSSLYSSGIPIITCLSIARNTIGNAYIEKQFDQVIADTQAGETLSKALSKVDGFTLKLMSSIKVGEESGSLDDMLNTTADDLEFESERAISQMVAYLEPAMIVVMAVIVGFIMISVIQPIYQSYSQIGKS